MKKIFYLIFASFILINSVPNAHASLFNMSIPLKANIGGANINSMVQNVHVMAEKINDSSSQMMKLGSMLWCYSLHSESTKYKITIGAFQYDWELINFRTILPSMAIYIAGFFIMVIASFYMFDIAFNLSVSIALLPLGIALWPFAWTKKKLGKIISNIVYYIGVFIFLPLGILIAKELIMTIVTSSFGDEAKFIEAYNADKSDMIDKTFSLTSLVFWKVILCYIVAIRLIPLLAQDFCSHFFGSAMIGNFMSQKMTNMTSLAKNSALRAVNGLNSSIRRASGNSIQRHSNGTSSNFMSRAANRYGRMLSGKK